MKILYIIHDYWPDHLAGSENYTHYIAHEMASLDHEVFVFATEKNYKDDYSVERYVEDVEGLVIKNEKLRIKNEKNACNDDGCEEKIPGQCGEIGGRARNDSVGVSVVKVHKQNSGMRSLDDSYEDKRVYDIFVNIFEEIKPDVVHIQHLLNLSIDIVDYVKSKNIPIVYTLHDLWLECFNVNRLTTDEQNLCSEASVDKCMKCYKMPYFIQKQNILDKIYLKSTRLIGYDKKIKKQKIQKRNKEMKELTNKIDLFISPSKYIRDEFIKWGIPENKIIYSRNGMRVIKNEKVRIKNEKNSRKDNQDKCDEGDCYVVPSRNDEGGCEEKIPGQCGKIGGGARNDKGGNVERDCYVVPPRKDNDVIKFVFTSHMHKLKGVDVLLEACKILQSKNVNNYEVHLYGRKSKNEEERQEFLDRVNKLNFVYYKGVFENNEINNILMDKDYLILPSIWPENAPLVIDEAYLNNVPCIVSNIGGMAERVDNGVNGLHFKVGDAQDLASKMEYVAKNRNIREKFVKNIPRVKTIEDNADELMNIYKSII